MRYLIAALVWIGVLYAVNSYFFRGVYFDAFHRMILQILQHVR